MIIALKRNTGLIAVLIAVIWLNGCAQTPQIDPEIAHESNDRIEIDPDVLEHFMDGQLYMNQGNYAMAALEFQDALQTDSLASPIHVSLAECYWHLGKLERAEQHLKIALKLEPDDKKAAEMLAHQYVLRKELPAAAAIYKDLWDNYPDQIDYGYTLANLAKLNEDLESALTIYQRISERRPGDTMPLESAAKIALATQNFDLAQKLFGSLVELESENVQYLKTASDLAIMNGDFATGIKYLERLVAIEDDLEFKIQLGALYYDNDMNREAWRLFKDLYASGMDNATVLYFLSTLAAVDGDLEASYKFASESIDRYPEEEHGYGNLALIELQRDSTARAIDILTAANKKLPRNFTLKYLLGNSYYQKGDFTQAAGLLESALEVYPESRHAMKILALVYDSMEKWNLSDSLYNMLITGHSNEAQTLNNYAFSLAERGMRLNDALAMSTEAIKLEPGNAAYLDTIGWIYFKLGKYKKAQQYIESAIELDSTNAVVLEHLGDIFKVRKKPDQARKMYQKAWELDPTNERIEAKAKSE